MPSSVCSFLYRVCLLGLAVVSLSDAQAQTQASCTFHLFNLSSNPSNPVIYVSGVNDYGTVVGSADFGNPGTPRFNAFAHYSGGGVSYWAPSGAKDSSFDGRNNSGATTADYVDSSGQTHPQMLKGSTSIPITSPKGAQPAGINRYDTVVGSYLDSNGNTHGFKRYKDASFIHLDYPGAKGTLPIGTNDYGAVVGFYDDNANAEHGFITHGLQWATLDYPNSTITTELFGISNAGVIVGITGGPRSFIYVNGTFKLIKVPNSIATEARAIAPSGLIAGRVKMSDGYHGFTATCH